MVSMKDLKLVLDRVVDASMAHVQRSLAPVVAAQERIGLRMGNLERRLYKATKGDAGVQGPPGPQGDVGPMPRHRWQDTKLQFLQGPSGEQWGDAVDLRGPPGPDGVARNSYGLPMAGAGGGLPGVYGGIPGGAAQSGSTFSYWPSGWA